MRSSSFRFIAIVAAAAPAVLAPAALAVLAPAALADVETIPDGYAGPRPVVDRANPRAMPATGEFVCDASTHIGDPSLRWTSVAGTPAGYVIGNCRDGWTLRRTWQSAWVVNERRYYEGGLIAGDFADCGWIPGNRVTLIGEYREELCGKSASHGAATYGRVFNSAPGSYGDGTNREGDYRLVSTGACPGFANLRPWDPAALPANHLRTRLPGYDKFYWRYVAVHPDALPWVMVRDAGVPSGGGNWVFVPRHCLPDRLPYGQGGPWVPPGGVSGQRSRP